MSISRENQVKIVNAIGQYLVDHVDEPYLIERSDLTGNDIWIHLKRCEEKDENRSD